MNLGLGELLVVIFNLILIIGVPAIIIVSAIFTIRRLRDLEARIGSLEAERDEGNSPAK